MDDGPRLVSVEVDDLFHLFDHYIPLNEEGITIIHALNGYGKTTILNMLYNIFSEQFWHLRRIVFERITLSFSDGFALRFLAPRNKTALPVQLLLVQQGIQKVIQEGDIKIHASKNSGFDISDYIPSLVRVDTDEWIDRRLDRVLSFREILDLYSDQLPQRVRSALAPAVLPEWVQDRIRLLDCRFIQAQRLLREFDDETDRYYGPRRRRRRHSPVIEDDAAKVAEFFQSQYNEYASQSQSLDQDFPQRVIRAITNKQRLDVSALDSRLKDVNAKRHALIDVGLLNKESFPFQPDTEMYEDIEIAAVLNTYAEDMEKKLDVFNTIYQKANIFLRVINKRLRHKQMRLDRTDGILIFNDQGGRVPLSSLSSGEQHQIVMMFELVFRTDPGDFVLIDEPELSLHISWQQEFLNDLDEIIQINKMYFLVATHSPQIINDRWDLTVALRDREA